jgi:hypothetical protein
MFWRKNLNKIKAILRLCSHLCRDAQKPLISVQNSALHRMVRPMMTEILPALLALAMMTGAASAHQAVTPHVWG